MNKEAKLKIPRLFYRIALIDHISQQHDTFLHKLKIFLLIFKYFLKLSRTLLITILYSNCKFMKFFEQDKKFSHKTSDMSGYYC